MTAAATDAEPVAPARPRLGPFRRRDRGGRHGPRPLGLPVVVALAVLVLAEVAVRVGRTHLTEPVVWPSPELQTKYRQIGGLADRGERPDVILVGDSMMDAGGDPGALTEASGLRTYNASVAGETLPVISDWMTKIVMPKLRPRLVVIGFSSNELNPRALGAESGVDAYRSSRVVRAASGTGNVVDRADAFLRDHSMLYRYRASLRHVLGPPAVGPEVFDPELSPSGHVLDFVDLAYLERGGPSQAQAVIRGVIAALQGFRVGIENVRVLQEMIRTVRRQGARVLLVAMPVTGDLVRFHPQGQADYLAAMDAFAGAAQRSGASFVQAGVWPTAQFADPVHVNGAGAERLTAFLAPLVQEEATKADLRPVG